MTDSWLRVAQANRQMDPGTLGGTVRSASPVRELIRQPRGGAAKVATLFVAVGWVGDDWEQTNIIYSEDGQTWQQAHVDPVDEEGVSLWTVHHHDGVWVAGGSDPGGGVPIVLRSTNGVDWDRIVLSTSGFDVVWTVAGRPGQWVAFSREGDVWTSPDAITWTHQGATGTTRIRDALWDGSRWVAVGGNHTGVVIESTDGVTWTVTDHLDTGPHWGIATDGTRQVIIGWTPSDATRYYRDDDDPWTAFPFTDDDETRIIEATAVAYRSGRWAAVSIHHHIYASPTGLSPYQSRWGANATAGIPPFVEWWDVVADAAGWVAVGFTSDGPYVGYSVGGLSWTVDSVDAVGLLTSVAAGVGA